MIVVAEAQASLTNIVHLGQIIIFLFMHHIK